MGKWVRTVAVSAAGVLVVAGLALSAGPAASEPPVVEKLPDLQTVIPKDSFSIVTTADGPEFRYTHLIYDAGPGPLEIQPAYDSASGGYRGMQQIFGQNAAGQWSMTRQTRVPDTFVFHAEHGHFHFPMATFGLYKVASDGGIGAPAALSPKIGFCIDDSYIYGHDVANVGTFVGTRSSCADPTGLRGISVGGADEYDYRDPGQAVPIKGLADGTYWFRAVSDPYDDFVELNEANNEEDVKVTIKAGKVTVGESRFPDTTPSPATLTAPVEGAVATGTTTLEATTPATGVRSVDFVVDGEVVGSRTAPPYALAWNSETVVDGSHWVAARITDAAGNSGTTDVHAVTVANSGPPAGSSFALDGATSRDGSEPQTVSLPSLHGDDLLVAYVSADGPDGSPQTTAVSGSGLDWTLVSRANDQPGSAEVWTARLGSAATTAEVSAVPAIAGHDQSLTLMAFRGAAGVGAAAHAGSASGAPATTLTTTKAGSWVFGVGNDWSTATARTLPSGQVVQHQWVDTPAGDTFWVQSQQHVTAETGAVVDVSTTAPVGSRWNLAAVEVTSASSGGVDGNAPRVTLSDPEAGARLAGPVRIAATAADDVGVSEVTFLVDGRTVGRDTAPPFVTEWNSASVAKGTHTITAQAVDRAGNVGTSAPRTVTVDNSGPPPQTIKVDGSVVKQGHDTIKTPSLTTKYAGDLVVAYVALDGPTTAGQTARVSGGGLSWTLVKRSNTQAGTAEIWSAKAKGKLTRKVVTATPSVKGHHGMLSVVAYRGADRTGVAGAAGAPKGAPSIYLPGVARASWAFAVGNDWDRAVARTPVAGQTVQRQWVDKVAGNTFWVQSTSKPSTTTGLVTLADTAPTDDRWNYAAVELVAKGGSTSSSTAQVHEHEDGTARH